MHIVALFFESPHSRTTFRTWITRWQNAVQYEQCLLLYIQENVFPNTCILASWMGNTLLCFIMTGFLLVTAKVVVYFLRMFLFSTVNNLFSSL